jgi:hypothetical protein
MKIVLFERNHDIPQPTFQRISPQTSATVKRYIGFKPASFFNYINLENLEKAILPLLAE